MLNEMMYRPVVKPEIVEYMRTQQKPFEGVVGELEKYANELGIPIVPHETAVFLDFLMGIYQPQHILEIGTAIGFSATLMAQHLAKGGTLTTIDRFELMYTRAKANFKKAGIDDVVTQLEGDAKDILPTLNETYDFIFMDSAKAKYYEFFPYCMDLLKVGGILMVDDIFQGGTILDDEKNIPKRVRKIHRRLNMFLDTVQNDPSLKTSLVPLGDGIILIQKLEEKDFMYLLENL
ncbi:Predicted O-methyltransferase YrrM [Granulicatella balaenopterae]|uniref:tRNA 5-hydroxyuridine methyltransferase n=1 Tax=Granulicatella balaenopterae TaxID=137733 RepID=A0A1H9NH00_9LACT|nr:O-methyltransferase [Granulicatella balaenopterae]SER35264.1 Predicted O-methyltransferase YrrM [Granulicatella balaenopterae]